VAMCLDQGADLHMAQLMLLPLTVTISCSSKSRLVLPSWFLPFRYWLTQVVPDKIQKSHKTIVHVFNFWVSFGLVLLQYRGGVGNIAEAENTQLHYLLSGRSRRQ